MRVDFNTLVGKTLTSVSIGSDEVTFTTSDNQHFKLFHEQDCCESVSIHKTLGSVEAVLNSPITSAVEDASQLPPDDPTFETLRDADDYEPESQTWSLFEIETENGGKLSVLFNGESNGYYSEGVDFVSLPHDRWS